MSKKLAPVKKPAPLKTTTRKLMPKAERREAALVIAIKLAKKHGARRVSLAMVAAQMGVTAPLLFHIFESRDGLTKAIVKAAKKEGVALPEGTPTVREARAVASKPLKKLAPLAAVKKPAAVKKAREATKTIAKPVKATKTVAPAPARKPLTAAQKKAKAAADAARRSKVTADAPKTPAAKFASLPPPFEASVAQVVA